MPVIQPAEKQIYNTLFRSSLAVAAPALVAFVAMFSTSAVNLLDTFHMSRYGMGAAGIVFCCLGYLNWKGRWWAGAPTLIMAASATVLFAYKFARPFAAYISANPISGLGDLLSPLVMLSPSLVVMVIAIGLTSAIIKGMRTARKVGPQPITMRAWGVLLVWVIILGGDLAYQQWGWQAFKSPDDLVIRLCPAGSRRAESCRSWLLEQGPKAVPALLEGMAAKDVDLVCMRQGSEDILAKMGAVAMPALLDAAAQNNPEALQALARIGDARAAKTLLTIYRDPQRKRSPEFDPLLKQTIKKLDPTLTL